MNLIPLAEAAERGELLLVDGGMCHFHKRRDGVVTIRELLVMPRMRRHGLGRWMVARIALNYPGATLRARCPEDWPSNAFWKGIGFDLVSEGKVNVWERRSSTVPTGTRLSLALRSSADGSTAQGCQRG